MFVYSLISPRFRWGDYGDILVAGMVSRHPRQDGLLQLERTGPFVPPISFPSLNDIVVTTNVKEQLETSEFSSITFKPVIKRHIVEFRWENWDNIAESPHLYPESGEPEDYILERPHSPELAEQIGELWELEAVEHARFEPYQGIIDWFRATGNTSYFVSEQAKDWLMTRYSNWVNFKQILVV